MKIAEFINEEFDLESIIAACGYRDMPSFFLDNPGAEATLIEWINNNFGEDEVY